MLEEKEPTVEPQSSIRMEKYMTADEVAERLSLAKRTVLDLALSGALPCIRIGKKVIRFSESDLVRFLKQGREIE